MGRITTTDSVGINYIEWGRRDRETVLFIHGLGTDNLGWVRQRRAFGRRFRCIAVDNRGSGRSDKPVGPYTLQRMATDALEVLDSVGVQRAHVIGASMGGGLAQILAVTHPSRVASLVLACTACDLRWREQLFDEWEDLILTKGMRAFAIEDFGWIFGPRSVRRLYPVAAVFGPLMLRAPRDAFLAQLDAIRSFDNRSLNALRRIEVPTLVITGSQDLLTPVADAEEIAARIPRSELAVVRGQAHGFMVEGAGVFNDVALEFLNRVIQMRSCLKGVVSSRA